MREQLGSICPGLMALRIKLSEATGLLDDIIIRQSVPNSETAPNSTAAVEERVTTNALDVPDATEVVSRELAARLADIHIPAAGDKDEEKEK